MNKKEAIKYLQQLYSNGGHCWLDEQRTEAIDMAIKALQEEPESIWHDANEKPNIKEKGCIFVITSLNGEYIGSRYYNHNDITINFGNYDKWAYLNDLLNLSNVQRTVKDRKEPVSEDLEEAASRYAKEEYNHKSPATLPDRCIGCYAPLMYAFKAGAEWKEKRLLPMIDKICGMCQKQQDFINSKDLGELISTLSRRYPEVSFAKLSRIAVRVTKWQKEHLWKPADGDDLPEYEREVVVFTQNFPNDAGMMSVSIAHRPNPDGFDGKSLTTGEVEHYTPKTYGKGGWNIPDIVYWLDIELLKEIEL